MKQIILAFLSLLTLGSACTSESRGNGGVCCDPVVVPCNGASSSGYVPSISGLSVCSDGQTYAADNCREWGCEIWPKGCPCSRRSENMGAYCVTPGEKEDTGIGCESTQHNFWLCAEANAEEAGVDPDLWTSWCVPPHTTGNAPSYCVNWEDPPSPFFDTSHALFYIFIFIIVPTVVGGLIACWKIKKDGCGTQTAYTPAQVAAAQHGARVVPTVGGSAPVMMPMTAPVAAAGQTSPAQRLQGVKNLLDQGLITQAEHDAKRAAIIDEV